MNATRRNSCWEASPTPVSSWMFRRRWCHAMYRHVVMGFKPWESRESMGIQDQTHQTPIKRQSNHWNFHWNQENASRDKSSRDHPAIFDPKLVNQSGPHFDVVSSHHQFFNLFAVLYLFHFILLYDYIWPIISIITSNSTIMYFPWNTIPYKVWMATSEI